MPDTASDPDLPRLNGFTRVERMLCTTRLRDIIAVTCNGWITDFYQFSNISLAVHFEIPVRHLALFAESLAEAQITLSSSSESALKDQRLSDTSSSIEGTLQLTFIHNEPDLRRHVPAVPG